MLSAEEVVEMQEIVAGVQVALPVKQYIVNIVSATREHPQIATGVSGRGAVLLLRAAQGWASFSGRDFVVPEDVKDVAPVVLSHRIVVNGITRMAAKELVGELLDSIPVPV